jgi:hypothetical protein
MKKLLKGLCRLLIVLVIVGVVLGFVRKWFQVASESTEQTIQVTLTVDKEKLLEDKESAQEAARNLYQKALDLTGKGEKASAEAVKQPSEEKPAP